MVAVIHQGESELDVRQRIAWAKLEVAEQWCWTIAMLSGAVLQLKWDTWWLSTAVGIAVFFLVPYPYDRAYMAASDEYEKATGTGKYYRQPEA